MERHKKCLCLLVQWMTSFFVLCDAYLTMDNRGKSFLLPFIENYGENTTLTVVVTSEYDATMYVNDPTKPGGPQEFELLAGTSQHLQLGNVTTTANGPAQKKAVFIIASHPISVNAYSLEAGTSEGYLALPVETLGIHYIVVTYSNVSPYYSGRVAVAAVENNTDITVTLRLGVAQATCGDRLVKEGTQLTFKLQAQEVISISCDGSDFTGTVITSSKPVAVVSGNTCVQVIRLSCDHLVEMMVPTSALGTQYLLHTFSGRDNGAIYRIVFRDNDTKISYSSGITPNKSSPHFQEVMLAQNQVAFVSADKPILVAGFALSEGSDFYTFPGDPFMAVMPALDRAPKYYLLDLGVTSKGGGFSCYVTVVVRSEFAEGVMIGRDTLPTASATGDYFIAAATRNTWPVKIWHTNVSADFTVLSYGFRNREGFGFPAGLRVPNFSGVDECSSSPCQNGGICYEVGMSYRCMCVDIFGGANCETDLVNDCLLTSCAEGATCVDAVRSFFCLCPQDRTGTSCEKNLTMPSTVTSTYSPTTTAIATTTTAITATTTSVTTTKPITFVYNHHYSVKLDNKPNYQHPSHHQPGHKMEISGCGHSSTATTTAVKEAGHEAMYLCPCACEHLEKHPHEHDTDRLEIRQHHVLQEIKEELSMDVKGTSKAQEVVT
ncbi:IgGFc-binding protein-like isoform X2 [Pomacea canaliculata]|uniref:IgGFc-binding protein-like isoform X2 n=1 Tax=Pomacea canaliculata TaxID=400727 RepID=UPI000D72D7E0|nr:IgGFc-binding protein-like isoform X2 [Pomacea canaliculata]